MAPKLPTQCPHCGRNTRSAQALDGHLKYSCPTLIKKRSGR